MNDHESLSLFEVIGVIFTQTVIPIVIVICFVTILVVLWRAKRIPNTMDLRYLLNAIGFFVFSLALPFLAFLVELMFELSRNRAFNDTLLVISTGAIVSGTYCLLKGVQQLRAKGDAA